MYCEQAGVVLAQDFELGHSRCTGLARNNEARGIGRVYRIRAQGRYQQTDNEEFVQEYSCQYVDVWMRPKGGHSDASMRVRDAHHASYLGIVLG